MTDANTPPTDGVETERIPNPIKPPVSPVPAKRTEGGFHAILYRVEWLVGPWVAVIHDGAMIAAAWLLAYWFQYNLPASFLTMPARFFDTAAQLLPAVMVIQVGALAYCGLYRSVWRYTSLTDLVRIAKAVTLGTVGIAMLSFFLIRGQALPRIVLLLYPLLLVLLLTGPRVLYRLLKDHGWHPGLRRGDGQKVLVVGAGAAKKDWCQALHFTGGQEGLVSGLTFYTLNTYRSSPLHLDLASRRLELRHTLEFTQRPFFPHDKKWRTNI